MYPKYPEMWKWRMANDMDYVDVNALDVGGVPLDTFSPNPQNMANFGSGFGLYFMMVHFYAAEWLAIVLVILIQFMWQVKSALVPYYRGTASDPLNTDARYFGGWGFSYHQELYGLGGILIAFLLDVIWPPAIQPSRAEEEANSF